MTEVHTWIYLLILPILCLIVGYVIGRKTGWQLRDNIVKKDKLEKLLDEVQGKVDSIQPPSDAYAPPGFHSFDFNIIGIRRKEEPLTLQQQLEIALEEEDYEKAAQIRNQLNNENEKEK